MNAKRLENNPIITPELDARIGPSINGPSLIRIPSWIDDPLGEYYLYFAAHSGNFIRLAYADAVTGPWTLYFPGVLHCDEAGPGFDDHVASPDVHVDSSSERIRMYYHGCCDSFEDPVGKTQQYTRLAHASDGLSFTAQPQPLGRFYFRVFEYKGVYYALAKENRGNGQGESGQRVYRSQDGLSAFKRGPILLQDGARHTALLPQDEILNGSTRELVITPSGSCMRQSISPSSGAIGQLHPQRRYSNRNTHGKERNSQLNPLKLAALMDPSANSVIRASTPRKILHIFCIRWPGNRESQSQN